MNFQEIIVADGTAILLMLILLIIRYSTRRSSREGDKTFNLLLAIGIMCSVFELIDFLIDGIQNQSLIVISWILNSFLYAGTATVSLLLIWYFDLTLNHNPKRLKTIFLPFLIVWALLIISLIPNLFGHFYFLVDDKNVYARQPIGYIFYGFLFIAFVTGIVIYIRYRVVHGQTQFFPIWMFLFPVIVGCIIQAVWYGISIAWLGCAIGLTSIYLNMQSRYYMVDTVTTLYNRAYLEHKLVVARQNQRYAYSGIMLDIDGFKKINDTFGHSMGDQAIIDAARILIETSERDTLVFRLSGDEFVVLVRVPINQRDQLEARTLEVEKSIIDKMNSFNASRIKPYKIVFSMGHAFYDTYLADDVFFHTMDSEMYKMKQVHHEETK